MRRYYLDANVFIQAKNGPYSMDIVPSFWRLLDKQAEAGVICSSMTVYEELAAGKDKLADWAKQRKGTGLFREPSADVQRFFNRIAVYVLAQYAEHQAQAFGDVQSVVKPDVHVASVDHVFDPTTKLPALST